MRFVNIFTRFVRQPICSVMGLLGADKQMDSSDTIVRLKYEPEYDLLSVWVGAPQPVDQVEVEPGIYVRVTRDDHRAVGLEVLEAVHRLHTDDKTIQSQAFAQKLLRKYGPQATASFSPALASHAR